MHTLYKNFRHKIVYRRQKQMRHTTCLAQRNEVRLTSIAYAWLSLYAKSAQRSKLVLGKRVKNSSEIQ